MEVDSESQPLAATAPLPAATPTWLGSFQPPPLLSTTYSLGFAALACIITFTCQQSAYPQVVTRDAKTSVFSGERAQAYTQVMATEIGERVAGSSGASRAAEYLKTQMELFKSEDVEVVFTNDTFTWRFDSRKKRYVHSLAVKIKRKGHDNATAISLGLVPQANSSIMISTNFDTTRNTSGASSAAMVGVLVEVANVLLKRQDHKHDIILLFTDNMEMDGFADTASMGSRNFMTSHPWKEDAAVAITLLGGGLISREYLVRSNSDTLVKLYSRQVKHPRAYSVLTALQSTTRNRNTDASNFACGGMHVMELGYLDQMLAKGTVMDSLDNIKPQDKYGSLQHTGENVLRLVSKLDSMQNFPKRKPSKGKPEECDMSASLQSDAVFSSMFQSFTLFINENRATHIMPWTALADVGLVVLAMLLSGPAIGSANWLGVLRQICMCTMAGIITSVLALGCSVAVYTRDVRVWFGPANQIRLGLAWLCGVVAMLAMVTIETYQWAPLTSEKQTLMPKLEKADRNSLHLEQFYGIYFFYAFTFLLFSVFAADMAFVPFLFMCGMSLALYIRWMSTAALKFVKKGLETKNQLADGTSAVFLTTLSIGPWLLHDGCMVFGPLVLALDHTFNWTAPLAQMMDVTGLIAAQSSAHTAKASMIMVIVANASMLTVLSFANVLSRLSHSQVKLILRAAEFCMLGFFLAVLFYPMSAVATGVNMFVSTIADEKN